EEFLKEVKESALESYENQDYQFEQLVDKLNLRRDMSRNPLFDVMFIMQSMDTIDIEIEGLKFKGYNSDNKISKFDITLSAIEDKESILLDFEYSTKLFKRETIERMIRHFNNILKEIIKNRSIKLNQIEIIGEEEKAKILYEFNDTYADYPKDKTIHELFEEQVERTPDNIAVVFEDEKLTYRELNEKANRLARTLRGKGVKQDSIVGIMVDRSLEMIVGIMGILKAGGAYLPIDPEYPEDRISYMLEDSETNVLLSQSGFIDKVLFNGDIINLDNEEYTETVKNLENINTSKDLLYIIYTSGTTGKPKGTMIEHKNVIRLFFNDKIQFDFTSKDVWTMFHSYCFDFSVWEMYGALLYGGKLVLISKNNARDTEAYLDILRSEKVTVLNQIPTPFYNLMNKELNRSNNELKLRYVIFGGEALKPEMLKGWMNKYPEVKLINMYGITETTVHVTFKEIKEEDVNLKISNIGKPIPTLSTYIMNKNLKLQPIGVPGEVCVGGEGVARGYLNKKQLTEEKFVINPYKAQERIYKSGDLARMLYNGELEYLGRIDHQVKIRGFRIELGEIESQLLAHELVKEAVVIDKDDKDGNKYLCAYIVLEEELKVSELREHLARTLPEYMLPSYFIQIEKMMLTPNGKIDRKALLELDGTIKTGVEYEAPRNEVEAKLVRVWEEVLGVDKIGINDNFFELGGHSLKATVLVSRMHKEFDVEVPLREIFTLGNIQEIGGYINSKEESIYRAIEKIEEKQYYEASSAQKRMYVLQEFDKKSTNYNMPGAVEIEGKLEEKKLKETFLKLIERHETLRTSFESKDGNIIQRIHKVENINFNLEKVIVKDEKNAREEMDCFVRSFDLSKAPLVRAEIIKINEEKHILVFDMHHIISDGISMEIFSKELIQLYMGNTLNELDIQYKDYSLWQNNYLNSKYIKRIETYWLNKIKDFNYTSLPRNYDLCNEKAVGCNMKIYFSKEDYMRIDEFCKRNLITKCTYFTSILNIILMNETGQNDITIGMPMSGRNHIQLQNVIGLFLNVIIIRINIDKNKCFKEYLQDVNETLAEAMNNQAYPYEELHNMARKIYGIKNESLFSVMLNYMPYQDDKEADKVSFEGITLKPYNNIKLNPKYDVTFYMNENMDDMLINIVYKNIFEEDIMERVAKAFHSISNIILNNDIITIKKIKYDEVTFDEKSINSMDDYFEDAEFLTNS
ncbi:non-ribosomal peptide synthetase, partial [Clostridium tagluense]|uniref:non-ribosomal peptide synthetase n=1 Tax=Clostridium tagluense TaxID=360422 RepID=UPI001CF1C04F